MGENYWAYVTTRQTSPGMGTWIQLGTSRREALRAAWRHLDWHHVPDDRPVAFIVLERHRTALMTSWERLRRMVGRSTAADGEAAMGQLRRLESEAIIARLYFSGWARRVDRRVGR